MSQISDFKTDFNVQSFEIEPVQLIDQVSGVEIYIGISKNGSETSKANWKIKKISLDGTVWKFQFPNGNQSYSFVWDDRISGYNYI